MSKIVIATIKFYQKFISPLSQGVCRFYPSCSQYSIEAVQAKGVLKGLGLSVKRISKCHPFHPGGVDQVKGHPHGSV